MYAADRPSRSKDRWRSHGRCTCSVHGSHQPCSSPPLPPGWSWRHAPSLEVVEHVLGVLCSPLPRLHYGSLGDEGFLQDIGMVARWRAKQQKRAGGPALVWMDVPLQVGG